MQQKGTNWTWHFWKLVVNCISWVDVDICYLLNFSMYNVIENCSSHVVSETLGVLMYFWGDLN